MPSLLSRPMYRRRSPCTSRTALLAVRRTLIWHPLVSRPFTTIAPTPPPLVDDGDVAEDQLLELGVGVVARRGVGAGDRLERRRLEVVLPARAARRRAASSPAGRDEDEVVAADVVGVVEDAADGGRLGRRSPSRARSGCGRRRPSWCSGRRPPGARCAPPASSSWLGDGGDDQVDLLGPLEPVEGVLVVVDDGAMPPASR